MAKKSKKEYVLFGCPADLSSRYDESGYVGLDTGFPPTAQSNVVLVDDIEQAFHYVDDKEPGHGTPADWVKLFKEDYGLNVHPIMLEKSKKAGCA